MPEESTTPKFYVGKVVRYAYRFEKEQDWTIKSIHDLKGRTVLRLGKGRYDKNHSKLPTEALVMAGEVKA